MKITTAVRYDVASADLVRFADRVADLEQAGLDGIWTAEAYSFDAFSLMGYLAATTHRLTIGSAIVPIYTRTPALLAMSAAGVDALSGGRCILGIGASGPQVIEGFHGVAHDAPVARTREAIDICRRVWRREMVVHDGPNYPLPLPAGRGTGLGKPLKLINEVARPRIPIYVAALGERNVAMAAECAEGWLPLFYAPAKAREVFGPALALGAALRAPDLPPLEVVVQVMVAVGEDVLQARDALRPMVALYIGGMGARGRNFYFSLVQRYGFERAAHEIQNLYLDGKKDAAAAAVPAELLEQISLVGPASYVRERVAELRESGVTSLNIATPPGADPVRVVEQLRELC